MCLLTNEVRNSVVLDSGCTSTVAGINWINCFLDSLSPDELPTVRREPGVKNFRFGGGITKKSLDVVQSPCRLADRNIFIRNDIVNSDIPLLLNKNSMKEAKIKLDLENDKVEIFGKLSGLDCTGSGHYCVPLHSTPVNVEECMLAEKIEDITDKQKILNKIHKQFAHPNQIKYLVVKLYYNCETCKRFHKTPATPVVCLPLASDFNDVVVMDLKSWKNGFYILYLIDLFSRFTKAEFIKDKLPSTIIDKVIFMWIGSGLGAPRKFLAYNGGEFCK